MAGKKERHETVMAQRLALDSEGNARVTRNDTPYKAGTGADRIPDPPPVPTNRALVAPQSRGGGARTALLCFV